MKILILTGGNSSERKISFMSAKNVRDALKENRHFVKLYDLKNGYQQIKTLAKDFDILFPVLHGEEGEGGQLHKFLSVINKPIVGTRNYKGLNQAWNKIPFKGYCDQNQIPTSAWKIIKNKKDVLQFGLPCVLKASNGGSSREVIILKNENDLNNSEVECIFNSNVPLFVEKYLKGTEVTVGILNKKVLPFIEIIPPIGSWFSYENKYKDTTQEILFAPSVSKDKQKEIENIVLKIQKHFNLGSYFRIDFMIYQNIPYALDVNTIPGLTPGSLFPKQAKAAGISFNQLMETLIKSAK